MKFQAVLLISLFCLSAYGSVSAAPKVEELNWFKNIFKGIHKVLNKVFQTIDGVDCVVEDITNIGKQVQDLPGDIEACGKDFVSEIKEVLDNASDVYNSVKSVTHLRQSVCGAAHETSSVTCTKNMLSATSDFIDKMVDTIDSIQNVKPLALTSCVKDVLEDLVSEFTSFKDKINSCF